MAEAIAIIFTGSFCFVAGILFAEIRTGKI